MVLINMIDHSLWVVWLNLCLNILDKSIQFDVILHFEQGWIDACKDNILCVCPLNISIVIHGQKTLLELRLCVEDMYGQAFRRIIVSLVNEWIKVPIYNGLSERLIRWRWHQRWRQQHFDFSINSHYLYNIYMHTSEHSHSQLDKICVFIYPKTYKLYGFVEKTI